MNENREESQKLWEKMNSDKEDLEFLFQETVSKYYGNSFLDDFASSVTEKRIKSEVEKAFFMRLVEAYIKGKTTIKEVFDWYIDESLGADTLTKIQLLEFIEQSKENRILYDKSVDKMVKRDLINLPSSCPTSTEELNPGG